MRRSSLLLVFACACGAEPSGPNVVLITIDTLRADHLGAYGYARATSPVIDALARESILFEHCLSPLSEKKVSGESKIGSERIELRRPWSCTRQKQLAFGLREIPTLHLNQAEARVPIVYSVPVIPMIPILSRKLDQRPS